MTQDIVSIIVTAVVTGGISTITTVGALKVHINYLRELLARQEKMIIRAHARIDDLDKHLFSKGH